MSDYETFSLIILLIGLVISAITLGITIGKKDKNNRHQFLQVLKWRFNHFLYLGANTVYRQVTSYSYDNLPKLHESII